MAGQTWKQAQTVAGIRQQGWTEPVGYTLQNILDLDLYVGMAGVADESHRCREVAGLPSDTTDY